MKLKYINLFLIILLLLGVLSTSQDVMAETIRLNGRISPNITRADMKIDNQSHIREYNFSGTATVSYWMSNHSVAYSDEHYEFEVKCSYNWVTKESKQTLYLKNHSRQLSFFSQHTSNIDPVLFYKKTLPQCTMCIRPQYTPDPPWIVEWYSYYRLFSDSLADMLGKGEAWRKLAEDDARTLTMMNFQNKRYRKGDNIVIVAQQYVADDLYVNEFTNYEYPAGTASSRTLLAYGTKAKFTFTFQDGITSFSKTVNMHGGGAFYNLNTENLRLGSWRVTAQIIESEYGSVNYPESEILNFEVAAPSIWWTGLTLTPIFTLDPKSISFEFSLPDGQSYRSYPPILTPVIGANLSESYPLGVVTAFNKRAMWLKLPAFKGPIDLYIGIANSADPETVYLIYPDKSLHHIEDGLVPWKKSATNYIDETIFNHEDLSLLPFGTTWDVYLLVTPKDDTNNYHLWNTYFTVPHFTISKF